MRLTSYGRTARGITVDMSSGGVLVATEMEIAVGSPVEVFIQLPVTLDGCGLQLVVKGEVVRSRGLMTAIRRQRYEFRTVAAKSRPFERAPLGSRRTA